MNTQIFATSVHRSVLLAVGFIILLGQAQNTLGQWAQNGNNINNTNTGNVGIGTTNPAYTLDVNGATNGFRSKIGSASGNDAIATFENSGGLQGIMRGNGNFGLGALNPAVRLALGGNGVNVYNTEAWIENNMHVQGNETLTQGGRGRLRVGTAWGYVGVYSEVSSTSVQNDLVLGASSGNVRVGLGPAVAQNFLVPNGNVGIGTASPDASRLHLYSPSHTYLRIGAPLASQSSIAFNDDTHGQDIVLYRRENSRDFSIWTLTSSIVMTVTQAGNVGIGTTSPGFKLDVQGGQINSSGGLCIAGDCKTAWSQVGGGGSQWTTAGSTIHYNTGNVGVGTASPVFDVSTSKYFTLDGGAGAIGSIGAAGGTGSASTAVGQVSFVNSSLGTSEKRLATIVGATDTAVNSGMIDFWTASGGSFSAPRMRITSSGDIGIGTTAPTAKLHVAGDGKVTGNLTVDGNIAAKYQDVAEWVPAARALPAGTVVTLDLSKPNQVIASSQAYDTGVAGVVSSQPGIMLGEGGANKVLVATTGRVRIKVDATTGTIQIGDLLVTSAIEGFAMKSVAVNIGGIWIHRPGTIIGKALEPLAKGQGEILVLLSLQ